MYLAVVLAMAIICILLIGALYAGSFMAFQWFLDFPSLVILCLIVAALLTATRMWKDLNLAIKVFVKPRTTATLKELRRAKEAVDMVCRSLLYGALFVAAFSESSPDSGSYLGNGIALWRRI